MHEIMWSLTNNKVWTGGWSWCQIYMRIIVSKYWQNKYGLHYTCISNMVNGYTCFLGIGLVVTYLYLLIIAGYKYLIVICLHELLLYYLIACDTCKPLGLATQDPTNDLFHNCLIEGACIITLLKYVWVSSYKICQSYQSQLF